MRRIAFYSVSTLSALALCLGARSVPAQTLKIKTRDKANFAIACKDKNLLSVSDKLKNEFKEKSAEELTSLAANNCENLFQVKQIIDLNGDGQEELIVRRVADCPALINCSLWIFQKKKNGFRAILDSKKIERYELKETKTNGFPDIELRTHDTGTSHYFQSLKFIGGKYKPQKCWQEDSAAFDEKGDFRTLKKLEIRVVKCGELKTKENL